MRPRHRVILAVGFTTCCVDCPSISQLLHRHPSSSGCFRAPPDALLILISLPPSPSRLLHAPPPAAGPAAGASPPSALAPAAARGLLPRRPRAASDWRLPTLAHRRRGPFPISLSLAESRPRSRRSIVPWPSLWPADESTRASSSHPHHSSNRASRRLLSWPLRSTGDALLLSRLPRSRAPQIRAATAGGRVGPLSSTTLPALTAFASMAARRQSYRLHRHRCLYRNYRGQRGCLCPCLPQPEL